MRSRLLCYTVLFSLLLSCSFSVARAQGDLLISPLRVVFENGKKLQEINLANTGKDTADYVITMINLRMKEDGSFEQIDTPDAGQNFAEKFVRFFPHRVSLAPGEAQSVKVQVVKSGEMSMGEYRSHLYFRSVPKERPLGDTEPKKDSNAISIKLTPIYGITIPVIIRIGEVKADVSLSDVALDVTDPNAPPRLSVTFNREGNISVYGDMTINYVAPDGKTTLAKLIKGIGVYTPNTARHARFDLDNDNNGIDFHKGKLHIVYSVLQSDKSVRTVEADLSLQ
jgi:hypothetical protein